MEYASSGKGNLGVTLGAIGTGLGVLGNNGGGILGGLFGNNNCGCNENMLVNRYEAGQSAKIADLESQLRLRDSTIYTDQKLLELYRFFDGEVKDIRSNLCQQSVVNAQVAANLSCMQGNIATLMGLTKTIIPIDNVCPAPMPQYNSWTAPTATT